MTLDLKPTKLAFKGYSETKKVEYAVELDFYAEIEPDNSKIHHSARDIEMKLRKKDQKEEYWPQLLKTKQKMHFLKTDFDKVCLRCAGVCVRLQLIERRSGLTRMSKKAYRMTTT